MSFRTLCMRYSNSRFRDIEKLDNRVPGVYIERLMIVVQVLAARSSHVPKRPQIGTVLTLMDHRICPTESMLR